MQAVRVMWFKRDLRIHDNQALSTAATGTVPVLPIYIYEPDYWALNDTSARHWRFIYSALVALDTSLRSLGQGLVIFSGDAIDVFRNLASQMTIEAIYSHEETGNYWTYQRDRRLRSFCKAHTIPWREYAQFAVVRALADRDDYVHLSRSLIERPLVKAPLALMPIVVPTHAIALNTLKPKTDNAMEQVSGRVAAVNTLNDFLRKRSRSYRGGISSPNTAVDSSSRLSPYLSIGCLSMTEIFHALDKRCQAFYAMPDYVRPHQWLKSLQSFRSRLYWHCHFIQKLETEPELEFRNSLRAMDGLREDDFNETYFDAWCAGMTGFPLVDASMRCLCATGWINFRMRAMLVSFACYQCWLHWPRVAAFLAQQFTDYEPGIHYSQIQMQAGTSGINTLRVYNPIKQSHDQDPDGVFIKQWVPELRELDGDRVHTPWLYQVPYPSPIVDQAKTSKHAKDSLYQILKTTTAKQEKAAIFLKHGSRKRQAIKSKSKRNYRASPDEKT